MVFLLNFDTQHIAKVKQVFAVLSFIAILLNLDLQRFANVEHVFTVISLIALTRDRHLFYYNALCLTLTIWFGGSLSPVYSSVRP